jgi:hypothetical protein
LSKSHQGKEKDGGKIEWNLFEVNTRTRAAVSRQQNGLIGEFKMAAGDLISIRGRVGIERELVRSGVKCDQIG